jgi:hypothetical protein
MAMPQRRSNITTITFKLDRQLANDLRELSVNNFRTQSSELRRLISKEIEQQRRAVQ